MYNDQLTTCLPQAGVQLEIRMIGNLPIIFFQIVELKIPRPNVNKNHK
jgi:hypothetical protein